MCKSYRCPEPGCHDRLIHQNRRGAHESSSGFGQFIHDRVTDRTSVVDADLQAATGEPLELLESQIHQLHFKNGTQRLRILEHKMPGQELSQAQCWVLPIWRTLIYTGVRNGLLSSESGVFIVEAEPPWAEFLVKRLHEDRETESWTMADAEFINWMGGPKWYANL